MKLGYLGHRNNEAELRQALKLHGHPEDIDPARLPDFLFDLVMAEWQAIQGKEPAPDYVNIGTITIRKQKQ